MLGVSTKTFYKYLTRFDSEGVDGFYPRSRRPLTSPGRVSAEVEDVIVGVRKELDDQGWDAVRSRSRSGSVTIPSVATRGGGALAGHDQPGPGPTWPAGQGPLPAAARSRHRFEAAQPNAMWQMDGFEVALAGGRTAVVLQLTDDCSRLDLALRAAVSENGEDVWAAVLQASSRYGLPARFLTDNGGAFSGRRRGWVSHLEENLRALHVQPITSSVAHPQTCGKNERAHATVLKWLRRQPAAQDLPGLQELLDVYRDRYNNQRRKTHLHGMTPAQRYQLGPKDGPGTNALPWPATIRTAKVSASGCIGIDKHLLGVGRRYAGLIVTTIRQHREIAVFATNQLIAQFTLTGHRGYQPQRPVPLPMS